MGMQGPIEVEVKYALKDTAIKLIEIAKLTPVIIQEDGIEVVSEASYPNGDLVLLTIEDGKVVEAARSRKV